MPDEDDFGSLVVPDKWADLSAAEREMDRQDALWGEQNHPDIGGELPGDWSRLYAGNADRWKALNAERVHYGQLGWDGILLEEVYEALGEADETKMREELIQVAAVALQWAGAIRRRQAAR
ncbi:hypothetical protein ACWEF6_01680 [Amycolatopsis sp. NPDC004772]